MSTKLRQAFVDGADWFMNQSDRFRGAFSQDDLKAAALEAYPVVTRPRVFVDEEGRSWRVVNDVLHVFDVGLDEAFGQIGWRRATFMDSLPATQALAVADLFSRPIEEVE